MSVIKAFSILLNREDRKICEKWYCLWKQKYKEGKSWIDLFISNFVNAFCLLHFFFLNDVKILSFFFIFE